MTDAEIAARNAAYRTETESQIRDENLEGTPRQVLSPSGKYRLTIRYYRTTPPWGHSRGTVTRVADGALVCDIQRNYGGFAHSFVEKQGREFLIAGRSYMSQTIVDLERGEEYEAPGDHYDSVAFCWATCSLSADGNTLVVDGCVWGRPYELRFFDFTDPARGWPRLPVIGVDELEHPCDRVKSRWVDEATYECITEEERDGLVHTWVERGGDEMVAIARTLSDHEQRLREASGRDPDHDADWVALRQGPMYTRFVERVRARGLVCDELEHAPRRYDGMWRAFRRAAPYAAAFVDWRTSDEQLAVYVHAAPRTATQRHTFEYSLAGVDAAVELIARITGAT